jgi:hypothetical protein
MVKGFKIKDGFFKNEFNTRMTHQLTIPPAHVWDKIERILDEQDNRKKIADTIITTSFRNKEKQVKGYLIAVAGFSLMAGFLWKLI